MNSRIFYLLAAALWALWTALVLSDARRFETLDPDAPPEVVAARLDMILNRAMAEYSIAGAAAGVVIDGETVWRPRRGVRDDAGAPVTGRTAFNLGSVSKPLAGWTVMTLAQSGWIDLDAPASDYLTRWSIPQSGYGGDAVTVRRLLQHTAGLGVHGYAGYEPGDRRPADIVALSTAEYPVRFVSTPGERRIYSGGGYTVLQMIVEDQTGLGLDAYARAAVFEPMGMTDTAFEPARIKEVSQAFNAAGRSIHPLDQIALAATGAYASGDDMERFVHAHFNGGDVLSRESLDTLFAAEPVSGRFAASYTREDSAKGVVLGHGGNNSTWHAQIYVRPESGDGFYFLTNTTTGAQLGLDLACAWRSWAHRARAEEICAEEKALVRAVSYWAAGLAGPPLLITAWLAAGVAGGRRKLSLVPAGRGPLRLFGRVFAALLVTLLLGGAWTVFFTETIYWRSGVVFIDEIPLKELEWLMPAVVGGLAAAAVALWSSPHERRP